MLHRGCALAVFAVCSLIVVAADPTPEPVAIVMDAMGAEVKLSALKWGVGTRRLAWLADPKATTEDGKRGPLALEFRETNSTLYQNGIITYIPVSSVSAVKSDEMAKTVSVTVAGLSEPLVGPGQFKGINQYGVDGTADGKAVKFAGGNPKMNYRALAFSGSKPFTRDKSTGGTWTISIDQPKSNNPTISVTNPKLLISLPSGAEALIDTLPVRKGEPVKLDSIQRLEMLVTGSVGKPVAVEVTLADGKDQLLIVPTVADVSGAKGNVMGFVGEVPGGWKLIPFHTILEVKADEKKE